ncbi:MAG: ZIP family metal transporter [Candidatus Dadabacteria bacterium]|nr:MAG: ZIP family metal transporter [Candidatus Dadabacteria bacterium]
MSLILIGFLASFLAGIATSVGALACFFVKKISERFEDTSLGFAAGVMLAASFFSLIVPGLDYAEELLGLTEVGAFLNVISGVIAGALIIWFIQAKAPHEHFILGQSHNPEHRSKLSKIWLFIIAITLHNIPEGLAVGVGFGGGDIARGTSLAIGIGLQNIPEGLAVAFSLMTVGYTRTRSFVIATITGLFEPLFGLVGVSVVTIFLPILPWALGFAAGAMLFVISHEIIPETHRRGHENYATGGFLIGLIIMMSLDILLG